MRTQYEECGMPQEKIPGIDKFGDATAHAEYLDQFWFHAACSCRRARRFSTPGFAGEYGFDAFQVRDIGNDVAHCQRFKTLHPFKAYTPDEGRIRYSTALQQLPVAAR